MKQLECKQCKRIHELNEDEVIEFNTIISKRNLDPDSIFNMMNAFDGKTCRRGRMHEYGWNYDELDINEIFQKLIDDYSKINEIEIIQNTSENSYLENKIKEMTEKVEKNNERNKSIIQSNNETINTLLETVGLLQKQWLDYSM